ncbi:MAG TPA: hypothetical protein V6C50_09755 [Crinalium sp.]
MSSCYVAYRFVPSARSPLLHVHHNAFTFYERLQAMEEKLNLLP